MRPADLADSEWDYAYTGNVEHPIRRNLDPESRAHNRALDELNELVKVVILNSLDPEQLLAELQKLPIVIHRHHAEDIIDISPTGVNKWAGLQQLGLRAQEFIAFGNDANDISMFEQAYYSVCVGDHTELSNMASEQVGNAEQRVIERIEKFANICTC
ncbi:HAD hydrolase family protein [Paenibacillus sp. D2_2]|uniref:HAD family hydrolase n=1 Tax=Paenibacillus sp. D2_2 TaxID=3073092 RepID=UPI0028157E89|nr:HAD hydrolase family protein [Paenibacillus sp. D2_2]WMT43046.1 HAD hydrolase family protein [Paenibacillus sp. D2_2]